MKLMKNPVLSLFDKIHLKEECIITQTWITDSNLHHFMKISLQGLQERLSKKMNLDVGFLRVPRFFSLPYLVISISVQPNNYSAF